MKGVGFDWTPYMDFDPDRAFDPHGRGIAVARLSSFDDLEYIGDGKEVVAVLLCLTRVRPLPAHSVLLRINTQTLNPQLSC